MKIRFYVLAFLFVFMTAFSLNGFCQSDKISSVSNLKVTSVVGKNVYALVKNEKGETVKVLVKPGDVFPKGTQFQVPAGEANLVLLGDDGQAYTLKVSFPEEEVYDAIPFDGGIPLTQNFEEVTSNLS